MNVQFTDNSGEVLSAMKQAALDALEEIGLTAEGYAKKACPVDTGQLRNSITHQVVEAENAVYIGSDVEHAPYVELGTGVHYPGGRTTPWAYQDAKGNWHRTNGSKAQPYLRPAVADHGETYKSITDSKMHGK